MEFVQGLRIGVFQGYNLDNCLRMFVGWDWGGGVGGGGIERIKQEKEKIVNRFRKQQSLVLILVLLLFVYLCIGGVLVFFFMWDRGVWK